jgi:hypothetical protein
MKEVEDKSGTIDGVKYVRPWRPGVNFTNVLHAAFTLVYPESVK